MFKAGDSKGMTLQNVKINLLINVVSWAYIS